MPTINFRLGASVELTDEEVKLVLDENNDPSVKALPFMKALKEGRVKLGGCTESYIPGPWLDDTEGIPHDHDHGYDDIELYID